MGAIGAREQRRPGRVVIGNKHGYDVLFLTINNWQLTTSA
jgi:hypothetical protein